MWSSAEWVKVSPATVWCEHIANVRYTVARLKWVWYFPKRGRIFLAALHQNCEQSLRDVLSYQLLAKHVQWREVEGAYLIRDEGFLIFSWLLQGWWYLLSQAFLIIFPIFSLKTHYFRMMILSSWSICGVFSFHDIILHTQGQVNGFLGNCCNTFSAV